MGPVISLCRAEAESFHDKKGVFSRLVVSLSLCTSLLESHCFFLSQDNTSPDDQIQIQLVSVPMYGILTRSQSQQEHQELREYSSFTMEDISKHRIR